ncbi:hypothetical protein V1669_12365 [Aeromonas enteropelogenes]
MQLTTLANTQIVIRLFEPGDADEFVRAERCFPNQPESHDFASSR